MRKIDVSLMPDDDSLVILTAEDVSNGVAMQVADFRDRLVAIHSPTGQFIGMAKDGSLRLGTKARLVNGIWYADENPGHQDLSGSLLDENCISLGVVR